MQNSNQNFVKLHKKVLNMNNLVFSRKINSAYQISYKTPRTRSQSWSPTSSLTAGGDSKASLMANKNPRKDSQVSVAIIEDCFTIS